MTPLAQRFFEVRERIARACERAARDPASVELLAVSKFQPVEAMREAYALGQRDFGENYAQELVAKANALSDLPELRMRFIGALQRNKLKLLAPVTSAIETLANAQTARALAELAGQRARSVDVLIQVNTSGEAQKSGVAPEQLEPLLAEVRALSALRLRGLMTIPKADDPEAARRSYRLLRSLAEQHGLPELSMGMSDDLEIAIEEGATRVRVGTALFGPRPQR